MVMSYSKGSRYSRSPSVYKCCGGSVSRSLSRSRSISRSRSKSCDSIEVENPGNNLYVTGLSPRITKRDLEKHFSTEGTVEDIHLVVDPWTRDSRGFGFVTMSSVKEANRCIKYLDRSVLEGRVITVEKARRRRGRTPTPGRYLGLRTVHAHRRSPSYSHYGRSRSPCYSSERGGSRNRSDSPYYSRRRKSYSPYYRHGRSYSRSRSPYSRSPVSMRDRSYSPSYYRDCSPDDRYYRNSRRYRDYPPDDRHYRSSRYRSISRSISPRGGRRSRRSYSRSISPRRLRRSYSRSISPKRTSRRSYSRSVSPLPRRSLRRSFSRSISPRPRRSSRSRLSQESYSSRSRSYSARPSSRYVSRSLTPRSDSPSS